ncbi:hypothetical protein GOODEAATRI_002426 [Goodea atripinnis]|uniref:Uncharacterized protein n=1 Tax=Goodea atripinnis TaxID=208336 RepID=A0ABV0N050_9TELE
MAVRNFLSLVTASRYFPAMDWRDPLPAESARRSDEEAASLRSKKGEGAHRDPDKHYTTGECSLLMRKCAGNAFDCGLHEMNMQRCSSVAKWHHEVESNRHQFCLFFYFRLLHRACLGQMSPAA